MFQKILLYFRHQYQFKCWLDNKQNIKSTLFQGSRDGSFCIWDILSDALKQEPEKYNFAEEILITKTELEEKNILIDELKQKVDESKTECAYTAERNLNALSARAKPVLLFY